MEVIAGLVGVIAGLFLYDTVRLWWRREWSGMKLSATLAGLFTLIFVILWYGLAQGWFQ
jgi:hypothetical protein